jgi:type II secretory pathway pseudopilin PulG
MRRPRSDIRGEQGFTFVEVLIASVITLLVTSAVFYFVNVSGTQTQQIQAGLQLQMANSLITNYFTQIVRTGTFVCVGTHDSVPTADTSNLSQITIRRGTDSAVLATLAIVNDSLTVGGTRYPTAYPCWFTPGSNYFKVFACGKATECFLSMNLVMGGVTYNYSPTVTEARCRN